VVEMASNIWLPFSDNCDGIEFKEKAGGFCRDGKWNAGEDK
jgi:hypothetical protein